jgi:hypothetical protein
MNESLERCKKGTLMNCRGSLARVLCYTRAKIVLTLLLVTAVCVPESRAQSVLLANGGNSTMPIVISEAAMNSTNQYKWGYFTPTIGEKQVAFELSHHLELITGAEFDVLAPGAEWVLIADQDTPVYGLNSSTALAVDSNRNVYVGESGNPGTYTVYDRSGGGEMIVNLQGSGGVQFPVGIDVAPDGTVVVAVTTTYGNGSVQFYDGNGNFLISFSMDPYGGCRHVAFDNAGDVWLVSQELFIPG